jgi:hypothetical protein
VQGPQGLLETGHRAGGQTIGPQSGPAIHQQQRRTVTDTDNGASMARPDVDLQPLA